MSTTSIDDCLYVHCRPLMNRYAVLASAENKSHVAADGSTLLDPLITSSRSSDKEDILPRSVCPRKQSSSACELRVSSIKEPQCSYAQSVLNGNLDALNLTLRLSIRHSEINVVYLNVQL